MTAALVAFLTARLDEQEDTHGHTYRSKDWYGQPCPRCQRPIHGYGTGGASPERVDVSHEPNSGTLLDCAVPMSVWADAFRGDLTESARWHRADVAAKRRIVDLAVLHADERYPDHSGGYASGMDDAVALLAAAYAAHPEYRDEWRP